MADYSFRIVNQVVLKNNLTALGAGFFVGQDPIIITEKDILVKKESCFDRNRAGINNNRFKKPIRGNLKNIRDDVV